MTTDQLNEIQEWLSPLDKYGIKWELTRFGVNHAGRGVVKACISMPSIVFFLYFCSEELGVTVENTEGHFDLIAVTSVWEQICIRNL